MRVARMIWVWASETEQVPIALTQIPLEVQAEALKLAVEVEAVMMLVLEVVVAAVGSSRYLPLVPRLGVVTFGDWSGSWAEGRMLSWVMWGLI